MHRFILFFDLVSLFQDAMSLLSAESEEPDLMNYFFLAFILLVEFANYPWNTIWKIRLYKWFGFVYFGFMAYQPL